MTVERALVIVVLVLLILILLVYLAGGPVTVHVGR